MKKNSRRRFLQKSGIGLAALSLNNYTKVFPKTSGPLPGIFFTTGFKTTEVTSTSAWFWTRLCADSQPLPVRHARPEGSFRYPLDFDEDTPAEQCDGAVKGIAGFARIKLSDGKRTRASDWYPALEEADYTVQIPFRDLKPRTLYRITWEARRIPGGRIYAATGAFRTAPAGMSEEPVRLVTVTCQYYWNHDEDTRGFRTYDSMSRLQPDLLIHTGDYVYYDLPGPLATTVAKARHQWHAMDSWPALRDFFRHVPVYLLKDDHDLLRNDVHPLSPDYGTLTYQAGIRIWRENVPLDGLPYRTFRWGKDLQVWLVEGREYRSANTMKDGPEKTIWGAAQKQWFDETVKASDASFKILFTPTPVIGPDRDNKSDNHANPSFRHEGDWLRNYLSGIPNMFVVNGDRHWQYVSRDLQTNLLEFGSGPVSDAHAEGWDPDDVREAHRFLRVKGGFLEITVNRESEKPVIAFIHRDTDGKPVHEERFMKQ